MTEQTPEKKPADEKQGEEKMEVDEEKKETKEAEPEPEF